MSSSKLSQEEILEQEKLIKEMNEVNKDLVNLNKQSQKLFGIGTHDQDLPVIDLKGRVVYDKAEINKRYRESWPIIRCFKLPSCYQGIKKKIYFWIGGSLVLSYSYNLKKTVESGKQIKDVCFKTVMKNYVPILAATSVLSILESFYFDDFCDINSFHYMENIDRKGIMANLRNKFIIRSSKEIRKEE